MRPLGAGSDGSVYYIGRGGTADRVLWSFTPQGQNIARRTLPDFGEESQLAYSLGRQGDAYAAAGRLVRFDLKTAAEIWSAPAPSDAKLIVDSSGDIFVTSWSMKQTVRRSISDGRVLWTSPVIALSPTGSNMLALEGQSSLVTISPSTGVPLWRATLVPAPTGELQSGAFSNGRVLMVDVVGQAYGYRPGLTYQSLGKLNAPLTGMRSMLIATDSVVLLSQMGMSGYNSNFQKIWHRPEVFADGVTGNQTIAQGTLVDLKFGTTLRQFPTINSGFIHGNDVWNTMFRAYNDIEVRRNSISTGQLLSSFHPNLMVEGGGEVVTGTVLPDGDLLFVDELLDTLRMIRVGSDGTLRFVTPLPFKYGGHDCKLTFTRDGRVAYASLVSGSATTFQVNLQTGALTKVWNLQILVKGDFTYRASLANGYASKFDSNGRELWRIPRSGFLAVAEDGSVYVGNTKNRASDGSRVWTASVGTNFTFPVGKGVLQQRSETYRWLDPKTGATIWERQLPNESYADGERKDLEVRMEGSSLFIRREWDSRGALELDVATGATKSTGLWGFWDNAGDFYRVSYDHRIVKLANFSANQGIGIAELSFTSRTYIGDGNGTTYIIGMHSSGAPGKLWIARYLTPN